MTTATLPSIVFVPILRPPMKLSAHIINVTWSVTMITTQLIFFIISIPQSSKNNSFRFVNSKCLIFQHFIPCDWLRIWLFHQQLESSFFFIFSWLWQRVLLWTGLAPSPKLHFLLIKFRIQTFQKFSDLILLLNCLKQHTIFHIFPFIMLVWIHLLPNSIHVVVVGNNSKVC